jgi:hypothetical protein
VLNLKMGFRTAFQCRRQLCRLLQQLSSMQWGQHSTSTTSTSTSTSTSTTITSWYQYQPELVSSSSTTAAVHHSLECSSAAAALSVSVKVRLCCTIQRQSFHFLKLVAALSAEPLRTSLFIVSLHHS